MTGVDWPQYRVLNHYTRMDGKTSPNVTARARAHFSKILCNLHSLYARKTTKARLRVMITCVQHSFGTLPPGVMFQTLPLSSRALEGLGTRLGHTWHSLVSRPTYVRYAASPVCKKKVWKLEHDFYVCLECTCN